MVFLDLIPVIEILLVGSGLTNLESSSLTCLVSCCIIGELFILDVIVEWKQWATFWIQNNRKCYCIVTSVLNW